MLKVVIADTSCLIVLNQIGKLSLLEKLYTKIFITQEILQEFNGSIPAWIKVKEVKDKKAQEILELDLDKGEASAIALCLGYKDCLLIIDERKGRSIAKKLGLQISGTLGIILKAKETGVVPSVKEILKELEKYNFWISEPLKNKILTKSGEK